MAIHVVSFSGGKDSTAMLLLMIENKMPIDRIVFADTTKEYPDLYKHFEKVSEYIKPYGLKIETVNIDFDYWFYRHVKVKGKNKGKCGYGWPTPLIRWCTSLKRNTIKKFVRSFSTEIIEYHGIALDEPERVNKDPKRDIRYPLIDFGFTEKDALQYCFDKGFDWNGMYNHMSRVSCYCCPLASLRNLRSIRKYYPDLWKKMLDMDKLTETRFKLNYSVADLDKKFRIEDENKQLSLSFEG